MLKEFLVIRELLFLTLSYLIYILIHILIFDLSNLQIYNKMTENKQHFSNFKVDINISKSEGNKMFVNSVESCDILKINGQGKLNFYFSVFSHYDYVARPRIILDNSKLSFNSEQIQKVIKEIFTCSFCLDIFNDPVNNKNCLHKFCKKCIGDYIRLTLDYVVKFLEKRNASCAENRLRLKDTLERMRKLNLLVFYIF
jgi:hypothetical protein